MTALQKANDLPHRDSAHLGLYLAIARAQAGDRQLAQQSYEQAQRWIKQNQAPDRELRALQAEAATLLGISQ